MENSLNYAIIKKFPTNDVRTSTEEMLAVYDASKGISIDFDLFTHALFDQGFITSDKYIHLQESFSRFRGSSRERCRFYFSLILPLLTLDDFVRVLRSIGLEYEADTILNQRFSRSPSRVFAREIPNENAMHKQYQMLVRKYGTGKFNTNKRVDFQNMTTTLISNLDLKNNSRRRQGCLDALAVVVHVRVFMYGDMSIREAILEEMKNVEHDGLDTTSSTVIFLISKSYIARWKGYFNEADTYLSQAKQICFNHGNSLLKALVFTTEHALHRKLYTVTSNGYNLHQSILACDRGICSLLNESEDIRFYLIRFLLAYKTLAYLSIGQEFQIDLSKEISEENISSAMATLESVSKDYFDMDNRLKAIYRICMGRIHEKTNIRLAVSNVVMALSMEQHGNFSASEKQNMTDYLVHLRSIIH